MGLLEGRTILVTGVTMHTSIAFKVAQIAQEQGARVIVSNLPRAVGVTRRAVRKLDPVPEVLELDVTDDDQLAALPQQLRDLGVEKLDGVVHAIAFANPKTALGGKFLETEWEDVSVAVHTSTYSYVSLITALDGMLAELGTPLDLVLLLVVEQEEVVQRLLARGAEQGRSDDTEETIRRRLEVYAEQTAPLIDVYEQRGLVRRVDGMAPIDEVTAALREALGAR